MKLFVPFLMLLLFAGCAETPNKFELESQGLPIVKSDIFLIPMDGVPPNYVKMIAAKIESQHKLRVQITTLMDVDSAMYDPGHRAYMTRKIVRKARKIVWPLLRPGQVSFAMVITEHDINTRDFRFRYNFSAHFRGVSVISTARITPENYNLPKNDTLRDERLMKIINKAIGLQVYHYPVSSNLNSVMYAPIMGLEDLDRVGNWYLNTDKIPIGTALVIAAGNGNIRKVKELVSSGADINFKDKDGKTALSRAAVNGQIETIKALVSLGAAIDTKDLNGWTALMVAVYLGRVGTVKVLESLGADVNTKDLNGTPPLSMAAIKNDMKTVKVLVSLGANINAKDKKGRTALMRAAENGQADMVKGLLASDADVNAGDVKGKTALMRAAENGEIEIVKTLVNSGAMADAEDNYGNIVLTYVSQKGRTEIIEILKKAGARERPFLPKTGDRLKIK